MGTRSRRLILLLLLPVLAATQARADETGIQNPDFADGLHAWSGAGKIVSLDAKGEPVVADPSGMSDPPPDSAKTKPALQLELNRGDFTSFWQEFRLPKDAKDITIEIKIRTSSDFVRGESTKYAPQTMAPGSHWFWSAMVFPKADFFARLSDSTFRYATFKLEPGTEQTLTATMTDMTPGIKTHTLFLCAPPGQGSVYVESVKVTP